MLEDAYQLIAHEMNAMETLMQESLIHADPFVDEIIRYSLKIGGKRMRPALLFLAGKTVGTLSEDHIKAAAAMEFIHTASLIHDDILDGAVLRRHSATFNVRWNAQISVLAGDFLLTKALALVAQSDKMECVQMLTDACRQTCEGELRQIGAVGQFDMSIEQYLEIIGGKTAPLLACSAEVGAFFAGAQPLELKKFREFGQKLGLAFQMIDDVLDLIGNDGDAGKTLRTDLIHRKPTLPLILYLQGATESKRQEMLLHIRCDDFDAQSADWVVVRLSESGAIDAARKKALQLIEDATDALTTISGDPKAKKALAQLARFIITRNN